MHVASANCGKCGTTYYSTSEVSAARAQQGATLQANNCAQSCGGNEPEVPYYKQKRKR